ncbi:MAG: HAMP domain-containing sensor histidine kinase [Desulfatirhabdiaceae bacterium]
MNRSRWILHPLFVFIFSTTALVASLFLYIYWYMAVNTDLEAILLRFNLDRGEVLKSQVWVVIMVLSILVGIILTGIFIIFLYNQKISRLYGLQQNFINTFTHELKTPVTSLKLYLDTALKYNLYTPDQLKYIQYMIQDVARLSYTINRILSIAKMESGGYQGEFVLLDLVEEIQRFLKNHMDLFRKCEIRFEPPPGLSYYYPINPSLFEILLMNLLTNAVHYNESETPQIQITLEQTSHYLLIRFQDNGIGLEKSDVKKIFRKFYQGQGREELKARGSGLGLYLVKNIVRMHKGTITAESPGIGQGAVFTISLPYKKV